MTNSNLVDKIKSTVETTFDMDFGQVYQMGGSSEKVQTDLSQNDPTAPDYAKNRTHWAESGLVEILPEQTYETSLEMDYSVDLNGLPPLEIGKEYIVTWDGIEYPIIAQDYVMDAGDGTMVSLGIVLGDLGLMTGGVSTGEPFIIMRLHPEFMELMGGISAMAISILGESSFTMSIAYDGEIVHKLDNKYLDLGWLPIIKKVEEVIIPETTVTVQAEPGHSSVENKTLRYFSDYVDAEVLSAMNSKLLTGGNVTVRVNGEYYDFYPYMNPSGGIIYIVRGYIDVEDSPYLLIVGGGDVGFGVGMGDYGDYQVEVSKVDILYNPMPKELMPESVDNIIINSSTADSTKKFKLTVNDSGTVTATEITE